MDAIGFIALAAACAPLVNASTAQAVVQVESAFNAHAIGIVGGTSRANRERAAKQFRPRERCRRMAGTSASAWHRSTCTTSVASA